MDQVHEISHNSRLKCIPSIYTISLLIYLCLNKCIILSTIVSTVFPTDQLSLYKCIILSDFVEHVHNIVHKSGSCIPY